MVRVRVSEGILEGEEVDNEFGGVYYSFKGVPYAQPPIGDLRFKAPHPAKPWSGVRSAKEFGPLCPQFNYFTRTLVKGSEDCLYLNVYTPTLKPDKPLPVMFWIHSGGFVWGSGNDDIYGPEFLVRKDVVLVTFNYRLEILGFLCLDTPDIPGNAGMKDQVAALRWVKTNIYNFGGDPENVTIFGQSAGGASVGYHLISPMSKNLFRRAIAMSGSATCWWSQSFEPRRRAIALAKQLGCHSKNNQELHEFFKFQPVESLIQKPVPLTLIEQTRIEAQTFFNVASEKKFGNSEYFFSGDVTNALRDGPHEGIDIMTGYVEDETLIVLGIGLSLDKMIDQANQFEDYFVPRKISIYRPIVEHLEIGSKVKAFYFKDKNVSMENFMHFKSFLDMDTMKFEILQQIKLCATKNNNRMYFYKFTCKSERNIISQILNIDVKKLFGDKQVTCHCDDITYLFPVKSVPQKIKTDSNAFKMIDRVSQLWTNFAKFGNPTPDNTLGVKWAPYTLKQQNYLDIGQKLVPGVSPDQEEIRFMDQISLMNPTPDNTLGVKWAPYTLKQQNYLDIGQKLVPGVSPDQEEIRFMDQLWHQYLRQEVESYYSKIYGECT